MVSYYNSALSSMFPSHTPSHARHTPGGTPTAAAVAQATSYFPPYGSYHSHHQQFSGTQYPNLSDLNSNMYAQFPSFDSTGQSPAIGVAAGGSSPSWPPQWPHPNPFGRGYCGNSDGIASNSESWSQSNTEPGQQVSNEPSSHSPNTPTTSDSAITAQPTTTTVPPSSTSPGFNGNSQSSGSPIGTPTPVQSSGTFSNFIHGHAPSPTYKQEQTQIIATSSPNQFGLPTCITVTPQGITPDGQALSPSSLSPATPTSASGNGLTSRPQPARSPYEWMKKPSYQSQPEKNGRTRTKDKYRVVYSDHQRLELEKEFHYSRYITIRRKAELANNVGLSERQVKIWFQNRRAKERRALKKQDDMLTKDKLDVTSASVAMSAFTESLTTHPHAAAFMGVATPPGAFAPPPPVMSTHPMATPPFSMGAAMKFDKDEKRF